MLCYYEMLKIDEIYVALLLNAKNKQESCCVIIGILHTIILNSFMFIHLCIALNRHLFLA